MGVTHGNKKTYPRIGSLIGFCTPEQGKYVAEIYADATDAASNPTHTAITKRPVDKHTVLDVHMVSGGGNAMWIHPAGQ